MLYLLVILAAFFSWGIVSYMTPKLLVLSLRKRLLDSVDSRKVHTTSASRLGGICFWPAIFLSVYTVFSFCALWHFRENTVGLPVRFTLESCAILLLYLVGVADDILGVSFRSKFVVQFVAAAMVVIPGIYIHDLHGLFGLYEISPWVGMPLTAILLVYIVNAINLIDGIDGLSSVLAIVALLVYGVMFLQQPEATINPLMAFATFGALASFFYFNVFGVHRGGGSSKIFMGDTGTLVVGFIVGVLAIELWNFDRYPIVYATTGHVLNPVQLARIGDLAPYAYTLAYTMLVVPCFDVIRVMIERALHRRPVFQPDKSHIHHKLMALGMSQRRALGVIVCVGLGYLLVNVLLVPHVGITCVFLVDIVLMISLIALLERLRRRKERMV